MDHILTSFLRICREMRCAVGKEFLRKVENAFYFLFINLSFACFVLPFTFDIKKAPTLITAVFSFAYSVGFYFLRYKIHVPFGLILHTGVFLIFLSIVLLETTLYKIGAVLVVLGVISVGTVFLFLCLGHKVIVENETDAQQPDQLGNELDAIDRRENERNLHQWNLNGRAHLPELQADGNANPPPQMQANGGVHPLRGMQANGGVHPLRGMQANGGGHFPMEMPVIGGVNPQREIQKDGDVNSAQAPQTQVDEGANSIFKWLASSVFKHKELNPKVADERKQQNMNDSDQATEGLLVDKRN